MIRGSKIISGGGRRSPAQRGTWGITLAETKHGRESEPFPDGDGGDDGGDQCPECGSTSLSQDFARGEVVCDNCGIVVEDSLVDTGPDWRAFNAEQRAAKERTGAPLNTLRHDLGMGTVMWGRRNAHGKAIGTSNMAQLRRMQRWNRQARYSRGGERNLAQALRELKRMGDTLDVPTMIVEEAARLYRQAQDKNLIRGRSIDSVAASCLYAALRSKGVPRSLEEVSDVSRVGKRELGRVYKTIAGELQISLAPVDPGAFIPRFASRLDLRPGTESHAAEIARRAVEAQVVSGKDPKSIAAAALYLSANITGDPRTQREVSEASGVTEVTIRNRYKELVEELQIEVEI